MKKLGIFSNESGQDVIEYVLMGLAAVLIGAMVYGVVSSLLSEKSEQLGQGWPS